MIKIIENALRNLSDMQLNLESDVARTWIAEKVATAIKGKNKDFPEPLITIYEPKAYAILLQYLAQGYSCPRKMLINSDVEIVEVEDNLIRNINTPEEYNAAIKELN